MTNKKHIRRSTEERQLKCTLTPDELLKCGEILADSQNKLRELEADKKTFIEDHKAKVAAAESIAARCSNMITSRCEFRQVQCERVKDYDAATVEVLRLDTTPPEIVEQRAMTKDERQMELPETDEDNDGGAL